MTEDGEGYGEKDKQWAGFGESGERWMERAEAKVFAVEECNKKLLILQPLRRAYHQIFMLFGNHEFTLRTLEANNLSAMTLTWTKTWT
jgi:hypothetical protein